MNKINFIKKIIFILLLIIITFLLLNHYTYADSMSTIISGADDFISTGKGQEQIGSDNLKELSDKIYDVLLAIGIVVAVIVGLVLGIQFMVGSVEQKSKIKEALVPYVAGCVVIFGAFGIWRLVVILLQNI